MDGRLEGLGGEGGRVSEGGRATSTKACDYRVHHYQDLCVAGRPRRPGDDMPI